MPLPLRPVRSLVTAFLLVTLVCVAALASPAGARADAPNPCVSTEPATNKIYCPTALARAEVRTLSFMSDQNTFCVVALSASSAPDSSPTARSDTAFGARVTCEPDMILISGSMQMYDQLTKARYYGNSIFCNPCAAGSTFTSSGTTGVIFPTVLEFEMHVELYLARGTWLRFPTPAQGATCVTVHSYMISCDITQEYSSLSAISDP
jgi:hypothetical protein